MQARAGKSSELVDIELRWVGGLARQLGISRDTVRGWIRLGRVTTRRDAEGHHIVRADASELARLGELQGLRRNWENRERFAELIRLKARPGR